MSEQDYIEYLIVGDGRKFLNYWDYMRGNDVTCEVIDGKLMLDEYTGDGVPKEPREVTLQEFLTLVEQSQP